MSKRRATIPFLHFRLLHSLIILILVICFACPVLEMFDHWDHTAKTGQDSESAFVILAVCAGAIIAFSSEAATPRLAFLRFHDLFRSPLRRSLEELIVSATISSVIGQSPPVLRI